MAKQKLTVKKSRSFSFSKLTAPFKNKNNQKVFAAILILIALYLLIAFISFFFDWKADDSLVSGKGFSDILTDKNINNTIGGFGAYISNLCIKLWFGVTAFFIPIIVMLAGLKILGLQKFRFSSLLFNGIVAMIILPVFIRHFFNGTCNISQGILPRPVDNLCAYQISSSSA